MAMLNPVSCSYKKCGSMINREEDRVTVSTSTGNDYYHRGLLVRHSIEGSS